MSHPFRIRVAAQHHLVEKLNRCLVAAVSVKVFGAADKPVNDYLRQWKLLTLEEKESDAAVRALLCHTAGIMDGDDGFYGLRRGDPEVSLIDILEDGTIFINNIEEFVGSETVWAEKKRQQREAARIKLDKERSEQKQKEESKKTDEGQKWTIEGQCPDNVPECPDNVHIYREEKKREELEKECCACAHTRERENTRPTEEEVSEIVSELKLDGFNVKKFVSFWNACDWKDKNGRDVSKNLKDRILYWHETEPIIQKRSGNVLKVTEPCRPGYQRDQYGFEFMVNDYDQNHLDGQAANDLLDQLLSEN